MLNMSTQQHPLTSKHVDDACDNWSPIGSYVRTIREAVEAREQMLEEFCDADAAYAMTYARFGTSS